MPGRATTGDFEESVRSGTAVSSMPSPAAMRAALGILGVLDIRPEPIFDGLVALAAEVCDVAMAEIVFTLRHGPARKAAIGDIGPLLEHRDHDELDPRLAGRAEI